MAATALKSTETMDFKGMALQAQQLKANDGTVIDMTELTALTGLNTSAAKNNGVQLAAGATKTLVAGDAGKTVNLDTAGGSVVTLPAASGSGRKYKFVVTVLATSASHIVKVANSSDTMIGIIEGTRVDSGNAVLGFAAQAASDTITLNRSTTGSVTLGEWIELEDVATNKWSVRGVLSATGAAFATPFSATV